MLSKRPIRGIHVSLQLLCKEPLKVPALGGTGLGLQLPGDHSSFVSSV